MEERRPQILLAHKDSAIRGLWADVLEGYPVVEADSVEGIEEAITRTETAVAVIGDWLPERGEGAKAAEILRSAGVPVVSFSLERVQKYGDVNVDAGGNIGDLRRAVEEMLSLRQ